MNKLAQQALLVRLADQLANHDSWTGETHVQKAAYLAAELGEIDFDFDFILYKHGPFSFELRDELAEMRADGLIESVAISPSYGPRLRVTEEGERLQQSFNRTIERYGGAIDWTASRLGSRDVKQLERLATALWVTEEDPEAPPQKRAAALCSVKPHISQEKALKAVEEIDLLAAERGVKL